MALDPSHFIHLADGRFDSTTPEDLDAAFAKYTSDPPDSGWVIHFHGGLVNETSARESAEVLLKVYRESGAYPFFFIWESGPWETISNNLGDIAQEGLYKKLVSILVDYLLSKLGVDPSTISAAESVPGKQPQVQVEEWLERQQAAAPFEPAPFDRITSRETRRDLTGNEVDVKEIESLLEREKGLQQELDNLNDEISKRGAVRRAETLRAGLWEKTPGHLSPRALGELTGSGAHSDQIARRFPTETSEAFLGITLGRVAIAAARIGYRVIRRYMKGRDHGLYTTVVEEVLRDLYVDQLASTLFWNQMKRDTLDAFGDDPDQYGGTAFLHRLDQQIVALGRPPRITLVGHSAGSIYVCNFLLAADRLLPSKVRFDVVLLAPAVDFELFQQAARTGRIANIRMFALNDERECTDALLAGIHDGLRYVYPKSLLYFVAGLLETEVDRPLVGMQRYYTGDQYEGRMFTAVTAVRRYLTPENRRRVWSPAADGQPGLGTNSSRHGDFDREDALTLESLQHILRHGFESPPEPGPAETLSLARTESALSLGDKIDNFVAVRRQQPGRKPKSLVSPYTVKKELSALRAVLNIAHD